MLGRLFGKQREMRQAGDAWHRWILSHARDPAPFEAALVQDTLEGRFQMVTLVSTLVLRALREFGSDGRDRADMVYREVFSGFDHALREEGVGDASIARRMRKMGEEFFGLARRVDASFEAEDPKPELIDTLVQNGIATDGTAAPLIDWLLQVQAKLKQDLNPDTLLPS
ncbi:MAG: ubiquinol-cytochrome C chaperone family protein [Pseudomonadota bacterium]